jgi:hypothetical protein
VLRNTLKCENSVIPDPEIGLTYHCSRQSMKYPAGRNEIYKNKILPWPGMKYIKHCPGEPKK